MIYKIEFWFSVRYDYNMVVYNEGLFVFGGILIDGFYSKLFKILFCVLFLNIYIYLLFFKKLVV